jgi:hypothetical protein
MNLDNTSNNTYIITQITKSLLLMIPNKNNTAEYNYIKIKWKSKLEDEDTYLLNTIVITANNLLYMYNLTDIDEDDDEKTQNRSTRTKTYTQIIEWLETLDIYDVVIWLGDDTNFYYSIDNIVKRDIDNLEYTEEALELFKKRTKYIISQNDAIMREKMYKKLKRAMDVTPNQKTNMEIVERLYKELERIENDIETVSKNKEQYRSLLKKHYKEQYHNKYKQLKHAEIEYISMKQRLLKKIKNIRKTYMYPSLYSSRDIKLKVSEKVSPDVKISIEKRIEKNDCDYKEFENTWNDKNYGPIIASLTYIGCIVNDIPMKALKNVWYTLLSTINNIHKTNKFDFIGIYDILAKKTLEYSYCTESFNFLVDYFEKGLCNCECGSFLSFMISRLYPSQLYSKTFLGITPGHASLFTIDDEKNIFEFETTVYGGKLFPIPNERIDEIEYAIYSEQVLGLYILFNSNSRSKHLFYLTNLFVKMFNVKRDIKESNFCQILLEIDRKFIKTPLDNNAFDIIILETIFRLEKSTMKKVIKNNNKYIKKDMIDILKKKSFNLKDVQRRTKKHIEEIKKILQEQKIL